MTFGLKFGLFQMLITKLYYVSKLPEIKEMVFISIINVVRK